MSGYVGIRAKRRRRNNIIIFIIVVFLAILYFVFHTLNLSTANLEPDNNIIPNKDDSITSLASIVEELELAIFQKEQKINFRDDQINNLKNDLKKIKEDYKKVNNQYLLLEKKYDDLKLEESNQDNLINKNTYTSLQTDFKNLNILNDKNNKIINNLKTELNSMKNLFTESNDNLEKILIENLLLKGDIKSYFDKNKKLKDQINNLNNIITDQNIEIEKLKDVSHHGG